MTEKELTDEELNSVAMFFQKKILETEIQRKGD